MERITQFKKILYTAKTHTTGGRETGMSSSSDGCLNINLSTPGTGAGTNPEQLLAAGWSACFEEAMVIVASKRSITLPYDIAIDAEIDLSTDKGEYFLQARLAVYIPGLDKKLAQQVVDEARRVCPYTKAMDGNIIVEFNVL